MAKREFHARLVRIHLSEKDRWEGRPLYEAVVALCMELELAGATVYRGLEGFGAAAHVRHASRWPPLSDAPMVVTVVDTPEAVTRLLERLEPMMPAGLVAVSDVQAIVYSSAPRG